jgi:hypothetical protein
MGLSFSFKTTFAIPRAGISKIKSNYLDDGLKPGETISTVICPF